jgi:uncharacterized protein YhbP (UPF0306 family)
MSGDVAARITAFLDTHRVMSLAVCGRHGPHAANVFYVRDRFALLWVSDPQTRHSLALEANPHVAATVAPDYRDFDEICGVQVFGDAHRVTDAAERHRARGLLEARYPFLQRVALHAPLKRAYEAAEVYRLVPREIAMIDNTRGFGHKDLLDLQSCE